MEPPADFPFRLISRGGGTRPAELRGKQGKRERPTTPGAAGLRTLSSSDSRCLKPVQKEDVTTLNFLCDFFLPLTQLLEVFFFFFLKQQRPTRTPGF